MRPYSRRLGWSILNYNGLIRHWLHRQGTVRIDRFYSFPSLVPFYNETVDMFKSTFEFEVVPTWNASLIWKHYFIKFLLHNYRSWLFFLIVQKYFLKSNYLDKIFVLFEHFNYNNIIIIIIITKTNTK